MQRPIKLKSFKLIIFAVGAAIIYLASLASVQAEAPPGESYSPPPEATEKSYDPPIREIPPIQSKSDHNLSWLGLIGLAGLAGLAQPRHIFKR